MITVSASKTATASGRVTLPEGRTPHKLRNRPLAGPKRRTGLEPATSSLGSDSPRERLARISRDYGAFRRLGNLANRTLMDAIRRYLGTSWGGWCQLNERNPSLDGQPLGFSFARAKRKRARLVIEPGWWPCCDAQPPPRLGRTSTPRCALVPPEAPPLLEFRFPFDFVGFVYDCSRVAGDGERPRHFVVGYGRSAGVARHLEI
jgi:hypothetical protein